MSPCAVFVSDHVTTDESLFFFHFACRFAMIETGALPWDGPHRRTGRGGTRGPGTGRDPTGSGPDGGTEYYSNAQTGERCGFPAPARRASAVALTAALRRTSGAHSESAGSRACMCCRSSGVLCSTRHSS